MVIAVYLPRYSCTVSQKRFAILHCVIQSDVSTDRQCQLYVSIYAAVRFVLHDFQLIILTDGKMTRYILQYLFAISSCIGCPDSVSYVHRIVYEMVDVTSVVQEIVEQKLHPLTASASS